MKHLIARNPLLIAVISFSALTGACARETAPPRTAVVEHPSRSTAALGVTSRQAEAPQGAAPQARATMDLSATPDDAPEGITKDDADLAWRARHALLGDSLLESCPALDVSASSGKVKLRGAVPSALRHLSAVADVAGVRGVHEIDDQIETLPQAP
jgi:osmotically-inducible protein OsmY